MATNFTTNNISTIKFGNTNYNIKSVPFHATEAEWLLADYIPKESEIIVYDIDETYATPRIKIGDGRTLVKNLPFIYNVIIDEEGNFKFSGDIYINDTEKLITEETVNNKLGDIETALDNIIRIQETLLDTEIFGIDEDNPESISTFLYDGGDEDGGGAI